jgi:hypothetical protein
MVDVINHKYPPVTCDDPGPPAWNPFDAVIQSRTSIRSSRTVSSLKSGRIVDNGY